MLTNDLMQISIMASASSIKLLNPLSNVSFGKSSNLDDLLLPSKAFSVSRKAPPPKILVAAAAGSAVNGVASPRVNGHHDLQLQINGRDTYQSGPALRVSFQGSAGAYSEYAAKMAVPDCATLACRTFADAIAAVQNGRADRTILPVESTMEGASVRNYDLLLRHDLQIVQEISLFVQYCLLAMPGVRPTELRRVISHPVALAHCGRALAQLGIQQCEPVEDTAGAVEMLRSNSLLDTAAIASPRAAILYGLDVLAHGIQDESWNVTRFLLLAPKNASSSSCAKAGATAVGTHREGNRKAPATMKTSMVIAHRGSSMVVLLKVLSAFSGRSLNLTKLEVINSSEEDGQKPVMILDVRGKGQLTAFPHLLYVDFEGSTENPKVKAAIDEIAEFSVFVRNLGCYEADSNIYDLH